MEGGTKQGKGAKEMGEEEKGRGKGKVHECTYTVESGA